MTPFLKITCLQPKRAKCRHTQFQLELWGKEKHRKESQAEPASRQSIRKRQSNWDEQGGQWGDVNPGLLWEDIQKRVEKWGCLDYLPERESSTMDAAGASRSGR